MDGTSLFTDVLRSLANEEESAEVCTLLPIRSPIPSSRGLPVVEHTPQWGPWELPPQALATEGLFDIPPSALFLRSYSIFQGRRNGAHPSPCKGGPGARDIGVAARLLQLDFTAIGSGWRRYQLPRSPKISIT